MTRLLLCGVAAFCALSGGCALLSKSDSNVFHYYTPDGVSSPSDRPATAGSKLRLRLGRVNAAAYIKESIAYRSSSFEVGYFDVARWTEKPEAYVRRALERALFERAGIQEIVSGPGPALDVEIDAFEELRGPRHAARLVLTWTLRDDRIVRIQDTFTIERPLPDGSKSDPALVASALSVAIEESVNRIVASVAGALPAVETAAEAD